MENIKIFSCSNCADNFTGKICQKLRKPIGRINRIKFKNDNFFVQIMETVREKDVFLIQQLEPPISERIMELLITIDCVKRSSPREIIVVLPYFPYSRSDKKDQPRIPITAKLIARLIETAGANRVLTCDLHNQAIQAYFEDINCDTITARFELENYFKNKKIKDFVVVATDAGSSKKAYKYAEYFNCPIALATKHRNGNTDTIEIDNIIGDVNGKTALIFDDEVDTAGSILETTKILKRHGAQNIYVGASHGIFSNNAIEKIENSEIKELVITDTVPHVNLSSKIKVVSLVDLFSNAIKRINEKNSLDDLFER